MASTYIRHHCISFLPSHQTNMAHTGTIPNDWLTFHHYQQSFPVSEATTVTTTAAPAQLSPEGGVSKPTRRRSRASRRTPTTLLNTDTTNFRAMVQQFTGAPPAPELFGPRPVPNGLMLAPYEQQQHYAGAGGDYAFVQRTTAPNDGAALFFPSTTS